MSGDRFSDKLRRSFRVKTKVIVYSTLKRSKDANLCSNTIYNFGTIGIIFEVVYALVAVVRKGGREP